MFEAAVGGDENSEGSERKIGGVRERYSAYFDGLIDLVSHNGEIHFLIKDGNDLTITKQAQADGYLCKPPSTVPWILPSGQKVVEHYSEFVLDHSQYLQTIYDDILSYYRNIAELPSEEFYHLLVVWTLHTYLAEKFQYSPILCLYAVPERGKSRTGKGLIYVSHRGVHVISLREAYILRACHDLHATLFFDVMDLWELADVPTLSGNIFLGGEI